jgi:hypothetical protein
MMQVNGKWFYWILAKDIELMEYLPFRDKAGTRICEGDIVAGSSDLSANYVRCIVRLGHTRTEGSEHCYAEEYYGAYLDCGGYRVALENDTVYILGNEYEHPELLKNQ